MKRRNFIQGLALGAGLGTVGAMGAYSYSPARTAFLPDVNRGTADIGVCKSVKITNISETSWFDNSIFMQDVTASGGLLVDSTRTTGRRSATAKVRAKAPMKKA